MKYLAIGKVRGQCCDYGWGIRGHTRIEVFEASNLEEAKEMAIEHESFEDLTDSREGYNGESLIIYEISQETSVDIPGLIKQDAERVARAQAARKRKADEQEFERLKKQLGK